MIVRELGVSSVITQNLSTCVALLTIMSQTRNFFAEAKRLDVGCLLTVGPAGEHLQWLRDEYNRCGKWKPKERELELFGLVRTWRTLAAASECFISAKVG